VLILDEIRRAATDAAYRISIHAAEQMLREDLDEIWVLEATIAGEVIEHLPVVFPHPACVVQGITALGRRIRALWAFDPDTRYAILMTVSEPGAEA
jgi:hypothetical protein